MAIIPEFPGPTVTVRINGQDAKEYDNKETAEHRNENGVKICTKFIECKDDTPFTVHLNVTGDYKWGHRNHSLNIATFIDGEWAKGVFCREYDMYLGDWEKDISERTYKDSAGRFMSQNFQFTGILAGKSFRVYLGIYVPEFSADYIWLTKRGYFSRNQRSFSLPTGSRDSRANRNHRSEVLPGHRKHERLWLQTSRHQVGGLAAFGRGTKGRGNLTWHRVRETISF